jgi:hypothetical protein
VLVSNPELKLPRSNVVHAAMDTPVRTSRSSVVVLNVTERCTASMPTRAPTWKLGPPTRPNRLRPQHSGQKQPRLGSTMRVLRSAEE